MRKRRLGRDEHVLETYDETQRQAAASTR